MLLLRNASASLEPSLPSDKRFMKILQPLPRKLRNLRSEMFGLLINQAQNPVGPILTVAVILRS